MGIFDHWHPVLSAQKLRRRPTAVRLHGTNLVLFRTSSGPIGALEDCCPHRRMKLSLGRVLGDRLECPYHGWTFGCRGDGRSPSTPRLRASAHCFDAREHLGIVWVKSAVSQPEFPI